MRILNRTSSDKRKLQYDLSVLIISLIVIAFIPFALKLPQFNQVNHFLNKELSGKNNFTIK